jgi:hypothetical protein
LFS